MLSRGTKRRLAEFFWLPALTPAHGDPFTSFHFCASLDACRATLMNFAIVA